MVAVINNFGGFYRTWVYVHEARRFGASIEPPCVNNSTLKTCITGTNIYIGFIHIMNIENALSESIEPIRNIDGPFKSLEDFVYRVGPGLEQLVILIRVGAFRFTGKSKAVLLWEAHTLINGSKSETAVHFFSHHRRSFVCPNFATTGLKMHMTK